MQVLRSRAAAARMLRAGGIVLLPADTMPGMHCRADMAAAVQRLRVLKRRAPDRPFLVLCASLQQARWLAPSDDGRLLAYCRRCWPLTLL